MAKVEETYQLDLRLEGINLLPALEDALLLLGEVNRHCGGCGRRRPSWAGGIFCALYRTPPDSSCPR
jgi:hypothetical protein